MFRWTKGKRILTQAERDGGAALWTVWNRLRVVWFVSRVLEVSDDSGKWVFRVTGVGRRGQRLVFTGTPSTEELDVALRKVQSVGGGGGARPGSDPSDAPLYTNLWEHLSATVYPDGSQRVTSTIVIVAGDGQWRGCLSDKDNGRVMWKSAESLEALLNAMEVALVEDDPRDWRKSAEPPKKRR